MAASCAVLALVFSRAWAFPPYRSTDADTAPADVVEARVGLLRVQREHDENRYTAPLLRVNLGLTTNAELISELEYNVDDGHWSDGALGFKVISRGEPWSFGVETLALVPIAPHQSGLGVESQLLATWRRERWRMHFNAGGLYDARASDTRQGWRASMLTEREWYGARWGVELFGRRLESEPTQVQAGVGVIMPVQSVSVRAGVHAGLTADTDDVMASMWISGERKLW
jgi:hypothetical protein